jgi:hypothetical protein
MVAAFARLLAPGYGACRRCRMPWLFVEPHVVEYERHEHGGSGAFALCEKCWSETDTHDHVFYMALAHGERAEWMAIQEATLYAR